MSGFTQQPPSEGGMGDGGAPGTPQPGQPGQWGGQSQWTQNGQWNQDGQWGGNNQWQRPGAWYRNPAAPGPAVVPQLQTGAPGGYLAPPKLGLYPLRALRLGEIFDAGFRTPQRNAGSMFGNALLIQSVSAVISGLFTFLVVLPWVNRTYSRLFSEESLSSLGSGMAGSMMQSFLSLTITAALLLTASMLAQGLQVLPVLRAGLYLRTTFTANWRLVGRRIGRLLGLSGCYLALVLVIGAVLFLVLWGASSAFWGIGVVVGFILYPVTGFGLFLLVARFSLAPAALIAEDLPLVAALRRSAALTRGQFWRILGISLLTVLIAQAVTGVISAPINIILSLISGVVAPSHGFAELAALGGVSQVISSVVTAFVGSIGLAFTSTVTALLYVDARMRRDGLDIELMAETERIPLDSSDWVPGTRRHPGQQTYPAPPNWGNQR